jgi:dTDP-glucose 4,6-dehydratase
MVNFLITGGLGFQGTHLTRSLIRSGYSVRILQRDSIDAQNHLASLAMELCCESVTRLSVQWGSITDKEAVYSAAKDCGMIIHLAAQINVDESIKHPWRSIACNVQGTFNVLEAARELGNIPVIYASSCEVYGSNLYPDFPMEEDHPLNPQSPYAATKAAADRLVHAYHCTYNLPTVIVRPGNVYGSGQKCGAGGAVIARWINLVKQGEPITLYGTGEQGRDFVHVSDVITGYRRIIDAKPWGEVFNLGTGINTPMRDIANWITAYSGGGIIHAEGRPGEVKSFALDSYKALDLLGWSAKKPIEKGIMELLGEIE